MTISSTTNRVAYTGNGATTAFAFGYKFLVNADLKVYQAGTLKTITTHYTVAGAGDDAGGTVTFLVAPTNGQSVVIIRDPALTQATDFVENDPLPAESLEDGLDKLTIIAQRLDDRLDRAVVLSDTETASVTLTLPTPTANKGLKWNATADGLANTTDDIDDLATDAAVSAAAALVSQNAAAISAAAALTAKTNAETAETNAELAETNAETAETNAAASAVAADAAAQAVGIKYAFDIATTMTDPGTGDIKFDNATVASVTNIAVSALSVTSGNPDVSDFLVTWDDSTATIKGTLILRKSGTPATFAVFSVTGTITDNATWLQIPVTHVASSGTWSAADVLYVAFSRSGNNGANGTGDFLADGTVAMTGSLTLGGAGTGVIFEGTTADAFETTLVAGEPTADITITLPVAATTTLAGLAIAETFTAPQRGTITTDNDGSFNQAVTNKFSWTPTAADVLEFQNHTAGQGGVVHFENTSNYAITAAATTYISAADLAKLNVTGKYLIAYEDDGTNAKCVVSSALTASGV